MKTNLILIAGVGSGIGLHLEKILNQKGHDLLPLDLNKKSLDQNFSERRKLQILEGNVSF